MLFMYDLNEINYWRKKKNWTALMPFWLSATATMLLWKWWRDGGGGGGIKTWEEEKKKEGKFAFI